MVLALLLLASMLFVGYLPTVHASTDPAGDFRTALRDDWSTTVPVASSNIIAVGGPQANLFS